MCFPISEAGPGAGPAFVSEGAQATPMSGGGTALLSQWKDAHQSGPTQFEQGTTSNDLVE